MSAEAARRSASEITKDERSRSVLLWIGLLTGPVAWATQTLVNQNLGEPWLCAPGTAEAGELSGIGIVSLITIVNVTLTGLTLAGGAIALSCWRKLRSSARTDASRRAHWMAVAGLINSAGFLAMIVLGFAPALFLTPCRAGLL